MEIKPVIQVNTKLFSEWKEFDNIHPLSVIHQSPHLYNVYKSTQHYKPLLIQAYQDNQLIGSLLGVIIKEKEGIRGKLTSRSIITGGPLVRNNDPEIVKGLLLEYERCLNNQAVFTELREIYVLPYKNVLSEIGYEDEKRLNIIVDLTKEEETLWKEMNSKRRNEIRRAVKEGTTVKEIKSIEEVEKCFEILKEVYSRAKLPLADKSLFMKSFKYLYPNNLIKYFGAYYNDKLIGCMLNLCYKDRVIDWYAGSYKEYYSKYPNDILPWEAFKILKKEGYKVFDFGGAGKPGIPYGVRDYKKKFGGDFIELHRYQKVHKPLLMQTGKMGLKILRKLK